MKFNRILCGLTNALALLTSPAAAASDHLLISEVLIDSPGSSATENNDVSSEFVEIYNPTNETIALGNYILTDYPSYHTLPAGSFDYGVNSFDYMLKFPPTATLKPGQIAVVTLDAVTFFTEVGTNFGGTEKGYSALAGGPLLFEIKNTDAAVPEMINLKSLAPNPTTFLKTNPGEFVALIYWNGLTDLVYDVDIIQWGQIVRADQLINKSGVAVDGPDAGEQPSTYKTDLFAPDFDFPIVPHAMIRHSIDEVFEVQTNGNGITGHDETSENLKASFIGVSNRNVTPGLPHPNLPTASVATWSLY